MDEAARVAYIHSSSMSVEPLSPANGDSAAPALIFLVDDEPLLLELATAILEFRGYGIRTFPDAESALRAFEKAEPAPGLVITDYSLGFRMNGLELVKACRGLRPNQKFILLTGDAGSHLKPLSGATPDGILTKPYEARQLVSMVESILAR